MCARRGNPMAYKSIVSYLIGAHCSCLSWLDTSRGVGNYSRLCLIRYQYQPCRSVLTLSYLEWRNNKRNFSWELGCFINRVSPSDNITLLSPRRIMMIPKGVISKISDHLRGLSFAIAAFFALCYCLHPARFASHYTHIRTEEIYNELERAYVPSNNSCALNIGGKRSTRLLYPVDEVKEDSIAFARRLGIMPGGQWRPIDCNPIFNVAIILPYRNRRTQLTIFMNFIHPFLQAQNLDYRIFVVEQSTAMEFNRAKLFNVGFSEAVKNDDFHCFIFQDIDLIPQNLDNIYACTKMPRHMSSSVNTFRYNLPYNGLFGGAIALTREQFQRANGFSNVFYGWGGEDDDFYSRLQTRGFKVCRFGPDVAQYYMLIHAKEPPSSARFVNLETGARRYDTDGISNLEYRVLDHQLRPLYSWILADI